MLSVCWYFKGKVHFNAAPEETNYQFGCLLSPANEIGQRNERKAPELATRKGVIFHQDNAREHKSLVTRKKLLELS